MQITGSGSEIQLQSLRRRIFPAGQVSPMHAVEIDVVFTVSGTVYYKTIG
jgi:hypothetical protein